MDKIEALNMAIKLLEAERDRLRPSLKSLKELIRAKHQPKAIREMVFEYTSTIHALTEGEIAALYIKVGEL